jgi:GTP-binding protein Era
MPPAAAAAAAAAAQAVILVERETQAPIVLGRGGSAIKKLGSASRQQIEEFLGRQVYLELTVQVCGRWLGSRRMKVWTTTAYDRTDGTC